jgi:hypothetical protein
VQLVPHHVSRREIGAIHHPHDANVGARAARDQAGPQRGGEAGQATLGGRVHAEQADTACLGQYLHSYASPLWAHT